MKKTYKQKLESLRIKYNCLKKEHKALLNNYNAFLENTRSLKEIANNMIQIVKPKADPQEVAQKLIDIKEEITKQVKEQINNGAFWTSLNGKEIIKKLKNAKKS